MSDGEARSQERDDAAARSRSCRVCGGSGMPIVFHRHWTGDRIGHRREYNDLGDLVTVPFAAEVAAHCVCPLGRWIRSKTSDYLNRRIPDGAAIVERRSWYSFDPPEPDREHDHDEPAESPPTRQQINALFGRPT